MACYPPRRFATTDDPVKVQHLADVIFDFDRRVLTKNRYGANTPAAFKKALKQARDAGFDR